MRTNQKVRTIVRSQDPPFPEPGVIWIYKTKEQTEEGEVEVLILRYYENGEWKPIGSAINGKITPSGEVTKEDLDNLKTLLEGEITEVAKSSLHSTQNITWAELKILRDSKKLVPGMYYRITDYVATTTQAGSRSANHPFDIIVQAITTSTLSEQASAARHEGDNYFNTNLMECWKIWYALDNNTSRFAWADPVNGKGVIYRMIDEYGNDMPYDFKGIQFKRYKIIAVSNSCLEPLVGLYFGHPRQYGTTIDTSDFKWYYTCSRQGDNESVTSWDTEIIDGTKRAAISANIVFTDMDKTNPNDKLPTLLDNVFLYGSVVFNFWKTHCDAADSYAVSATYPTDCTFVGGDCTENTIVGWSGLLQTRSTFRRNLIVSSFRHCTIGTNFQQNTVFSKEFTFCQIADEFSQNIIGGDSNGQGGGIQNTTFGQYINQNVISVGYANLITNSKFGNLFARNTLDNVYFGSVEINAQNNDNYFTGKFLGVTVNGICGFLRVYGGTNGSTASGLDIVGNVRGSQGNEVYIECSDWIYPDAQGMKPRRRIEADSNGNLIMTYWSEGKWIRKTKGRTGSTWTDLEDIIILTAPNNVPYRVTVDNDGNLQTVPAIQ